MRNEYDLARAIQATTGAQCAYWKGSLKALVMETVHDYTDACAATTFSAQNISNRRLEVERMLDIVFGLIPEQKKG